jgi:beta-barrel assembly-enhancing protease
MFSHPRVMAVGLLALWLPPSPAAAQLFGGFSEEQEIELGREAAAMMEEDLQLLEDEQVSAYVTRLGNELASRSGRADLAYTFRVVDTAEINAFALPGGFIYVHRGLIEAAENESELAGVLGHEIGHVVARHGVDQMRRAQIANLGLGVLGSLLGGGRAAEVGGMAADLVASGTFMKFSRDAEREADQLGVRNLADGGHAPRGMITFFEKLGALRESDPNAVDRFFASHPSPGERIENLGGLVAELSATDGLRADSRAFRQIHARLETLPRPDPPVAEAESAADPDVARAAPGSGTPERTASEPPPTLPPNTRADHDHEIAGRFAPTFHQALGPEPRFDYLTAFDFDGDWRGDNNWVNAADERWALAASVYYAVSETRTHYFVVYAAFHPRDYKGGNERGALLSEVLRDGARRVGDFDPTGLSQDAVLAHENDMEGVLVVARKTGPDPRLADVVRVETLAHNAFLKYTPSGVGPRGVEPVTVRGQSAELFIEPKGHGIEAYRGDDAQRRSAEQGFVIYRYNGRAEEPGAGRVAFGNTRRESVAYDLVPLYSTLWARAHGGANHTFGDDFAYAPLSVRTRQRSGDDAALDVAPGALGASFRGAVGGRNMARPPWGWFDSRERERPLGEWFLDPAGVVARHFMPDEPFSFAYVHHPYVGIVEDQ